MSGRTRQSKAFDPRQVRGNDAFLKREFPMSAKNFRKISTFVYSQSGIVLSDSKQEMVYSRLARRMRKLGIGNFTEYLCQVENDIAGETSSFLNAITTNLTSFFRENHHFEFLTDIAIPELKLRHREDKRIRIWCTAASTGEEPYSLAIVFREAFIPASWDIKILATDIDSNVLDTARRGIYPLADVEDIGTKRKGKWFQTNGRNEVKVDEGLKQMITFRQLNLLDRWPMKGIFDIVFCRNVIIYFDKETQRTLFVKMAGFIDAESYLFIGHSESLITVSDQYKPLGGTIYKLAGEIQKNRRPE